MAGFISPQILQKKRRDNAAYHSFTFLNKAKKGLTKSRRWEGRTRRAKIALSGLGGQTLERTHTPPQHTKRSSITNPHKSSPPLAKKKASASTTGLQEIEEKVGERRGDNQEDRI